MNLSEKYEFRSIRKDEADQATEIEQILFPSGRDNQQKGYYRPGGKNPGTVSCGRRPGNREAGRISYRSCNG